MPATDPYNANKPAPRRKYPDGYQPQSVPAALMPPEVAARVGAMAPGAAASAPAAENTGGGGGWGGPDGPTPQSVDFGDLARRGLDVAKTALNPDPFIDKVSGITPAPAAAVAPAAPAAELDPNAYRMGPQQGEYAAPEGVTKRGDGIFAGKGVHGEQAFSDSAFAPQFAGVAGASAQGRKDYAKQFQKDRPMQNASDYTFQRAREAEIQAAGDDYKAYVAAGSPRTKDGRGLSEYDFIQRRQQNALANFLDSDEGGGRDGSNALNRRASGYAPGADAKAAQDLALGAAKGTIDVEKGTLDIEDRVRKRGDEAIAAGAERYKAEPVAMARKYGNFGLTVDEAAALDFAQTEADAQGPDFFNTPAGRLARGAMSKIANKLNNDRTDSVSKAVGDARGVTDGNRADIAEFEFTRKRGLLRDSDYELAGPEFDKTDPAAERRPDSPENADRRRTRVGGRELFDSPEASFYNDEGFGSLLQKIKAADRIRAERDKKK